MAVGIIASFCSSSFEETKEHKRSWTSMLTDRFGAGKGQSQKIQLAILSTINLKVLFNFLS